MNEKARQSDESVHYTSVAAQHEADVEAHKQELYEWEAGTTKCTRV